VSAGTAVTVYLPCDVFAVRVRLGYAETITPVEQIALRAVQAGVGTVGELSELLGLSRRLMLDLIQDLCRSGYLLLVHGHGGVKVTEAVAARIEAGTLAALPGAESVDDRMLIMIDRVTGHVLPFGGSVALGQRRWGVPADAGAARIEDIGYPDLLDALGRQLEREERDRAHDPALRERGAGTRRRRVLGAHLSTSDIEATGRRWLPAEVQPMIDLDTERLIVTVVGDALPPQRRTLLGARLTELADRRPGDELVQALRAQALPGLVDPPGLERAVARLREEAETAASIPAGQRLAWHTSMSDHARQLLVLLDDHVDRQVAVSPVSGADHGSELVALIEAARSQIIICSPHVGYEALAAVASALEKAIAKGVQVVVLWGARIDDELDTRARNLLYQLTLRAQARGPRGARQVLVPATPARTNTRCVVIDDRAALVTSWEPLGSIHAGSHVGAVVRALDGGSCRASLDLLRWARSAVPAYDMSRLLLVTAADFALRLSVGDGPAQTSRQPPHPASPAAGGLPQAPDDGAGEDAGRAALAWSKAWGDHADRMAALVAARTAPTATVVQDGAHVDLLWRALRTARRQLVVSSTEALGARAGGDRLLAAVEGCLRRGVSVTLGHESGSESVLRDLARRYPGLLHIVSGSHRGRVLVWDDDVIVGGFDSLTVESAPGGSSSRRRSEIGLQLSGAALADEVARLAGAALVPRERAATAANDTAPPTTAQSSAALGAHALLNALSSGVHPAQAVAAELRAPDLAWDVLEHLVGLARPEVLRIAVAVCLTRWPAAGAGSREAHWRQWLVDSLWQDGLYVEAMLVRGTLDAPGARPSTPLAALAAARRTRAYGEALLEAMTLLTRPGRLSDAAAGADLRHWHGERLAVLAAAIEQALFDGSHNAADLIEFELAEAASDDRPELVLDTAWRETAEATMAYWRESSGRPLPLAVIRAELYGRRDQELLAAAWEELGSALQRAEGTSLRNTAALRTHLYLFTHVEGAFTTLRSLVASRDLGGLGAWLAAAPTGGVDAFIDRAAEIAAPTEQPMYGTYRRRYRRLLQQIVDALTAVLEQAVVAGTPESGDDPDLAAHRAAAGSLARTVCAQWPQLRAAVDGLAQPESQLVSDLLATLEELTLWAGREPAVAVPTAPSSTTTAVPTESDHRTISHQRRGAR